MAKRALSNNEHRRRGTLRADRHIRPARKPAADKPTCPSWLDATAKAEWRRLVNELHSRGLVDGLNRDMLAMYCMVLSRLRKSLAEIATRGEVLATQDGKLYRSPWLLTAEECQRQITKLGNELGLSPAARDRLGASDPKPIEVNDKTRFFRVAGA